MNFELIIEKLRQMAENEDNLGNLDASVALANEAEKLQVWFDGSQSGPCPVDFEKYGFNEAFASKTSPVEKATSPVRTDTPKQESEKVETSPEVTPETEKEKAKRELDAIVEEVDSPEQIELRRQLNEARLYLEQKRLREAVALAATVENRTLDAAMKEAAAHLLSQARRQLDAAVKKALSEGETARNANKKVEARKHYQTARALDPDNQEVKRVLLELSGGLVTRLSAAKVNELRAGLRERKDIKRLGEVVYEVEALAGEGKLTPELDVLFAEARKYYDETRIMHGGITTASRLGDLAARSKAVKDISDLVATGQKFIFDVTTNTEKDSFNLLQEANKYLEIASEDTAAYELDLANKQLPAHPRYAKQRLTVALEQPFSEFYKRKLQEKLSETESLIQLQEKTGELLSQENGAVEILRLTLKTYETFPLSPGRATQIAQARQMALASLTMRFNDLFQQAELSLRLGEYQNSRTRTNEAEKLASTWPEEQKPTELKSLLSAAQGIRQKIDATEIVWGDYCKFAQSIREQVLDPTQRAAALDLFREISTDERFKAFPDLKILASEIDNYKDIGEQLADAQSARTEGDWSRVFEIADHVIKSAKAGPLAEKFNELHTEASIELAINRAKVLLEDDDVPEANNILSTVLNKEKDSPRAAALRQRLDTELKKIAGCINDNPPMQTLFERASDLVGLRDNMLFKAFANPTYALRQARINVDGQATNPEMRDLINRFKKDPNGPDPISQELSERTGGALKTELVKKGFTERLEAMYLFRFVGGNAQERQPDWPEYHLSLRTAEARRAERLVGDSLQRDFLQLLKKAFVYGRDKPLDDDALHDMAERAQGLREAGLMETDEEKTAGRWAEIEWGKRQAQSSEARGDWNEVVNIWRRMLDLHGTPETQNGWRSARIQQVIEQSSDLIHNHHNGEQALTILQEVQAEPGIGNAWELHHALADSYSVLGNFESAFGCLTEAEKFPGKNVQKAVQKKRKELEREKMIQQVLADVQDGEDANPNETLRKLQSALGSPVAKDSRRLRKLRDEIFSQEKESLLRTAEIEQASGSEDGKGNAVTVLVDLQGLENLVGVADNKWESTRELKRLQADLAPVAKSVIYNSQNFDPTSMSLQQAILQAGAFSNRIQAFTRLAEDKHFSVKLEEVKEGLEKREKDISTLLGNLYELKKLLDEALKADLWDEAVRKGDFQTLDQYINRISELGLDNMREVHNLDRQLAEWKEIHAILEKEIKEIKDKFVKSEAFEDVIIQLRRLAGMPGLRANGQPWQELQQGDYDKILRQMGDHLLHIPNIYGEKLIGWEAVKTAAEDRQRELEYWQKWDKDGEQGMDKMYEALQVVLCYTRIQPPESELKIILPNDFDRLGISELRPEKEAKVPEIRFKKRDWEKINTAAQMVVKTLNVGPKDGEEVVLVHSQTAEELRAEGKRRLGIAETWLREAQEQIGLLVEVLKEKGFPSAKEFRDVVEQQDWTRLGVLLERGRLAGALTTQEQKQLEVYTKTYEDVRSEEERRRTKKRWFNLG